MSSRAGWSYGGQHFTETRTERGGVRFFVDGKPTKRAEWLAMLNAAKLQDRSPDRTAAKPEAAQ